jgi:aspartyl/asparaginyl beta-hydroxylase (cupin superfamily)
MYDETVRRAYPFLDVLDAAFDQLRDEALSLGKRGWARMPGYPEGWEGFVLNPGPWARDFPGVDFAANRVECPVAVAVLAQITGVELAGYLRINPGITLAPHEDPRDDDLVRCHVGLCLPPNELAWWPGGRARLMDVRRTHWAQNLGEQPRITMVLDVRMPFVVDSAGWPAWRPDVPTGEAAKLRPPVR